MALREGTTMMVGVRVLVLLGALHMGMVPAASGQAPATEVLPEPQPSVELPPDLARVLRDYESHWSAGRADDLAGLFVERGLIVRHGTWIRGRDAIREAYGNASGPLKLRAIEFAADGRLGYILGAYGYGDQRPVEDRGLFVLTLRRDESGRWLIVSDMDRSGQ
ncbi:MAG: nuclear transport factor 2 family protein [Gemmatimonadota bacterium]|nr:nuclear transport factor 2 family protein [Gemmatimonadota bacterium]